MVDFSLSAFLFALLDVVYKVTIIGLLFMALTNIAGVAVTRHTTTEQARAAAAMALAEAVLACALIYTRTMFG